MNYVVENHFQEGVQLIHGKIHGIWKLVQGESQLWQGANGIGKSSFLRFLRENEKKYLKEVVCSYLMQGPLHVLGDYTPRDLIKHTEDYLGKSFESSQELIEGFKLQSRLDTPIRFLSGGENQLVKLLSCLMLSSSVYFLDEATTHLDEERIKFLFDYIQKRKKDGVSFVLIEHHPHASLFCESVLKFSKRNRLEIEYERV